MLSLQLLKNARFIAYKYHKITAKNRACGKSAMMGELRQTQVINYKDVELKTSTYLVLQNRTTFKSRSTSTTTGTLKRFLNVENKSFYIKFSPPAVCFREKIGTYVGCALRFFFFFCSISNQKTNVQVIGQKKGF